MNSTQYELLATLADLLGVHVLLQELVIVPYSVDVLTEVAQKIVKEKVECLQEVSVVSDVIDDSTISHSFFY